MAYIIKLDAYNYKISYWESNYKDFHCKIVNSWLPDSVIIFWRFRSNGFENKGKELWKVWELWEFASNPVIPRKSGPIYLLRPNSLSFRDINSFKKLQNNAHWLLLYQSIFLNIFEIYIKTYKKLIFCFKFYQNYFQLLP